MNWTIIGCGWLGTALAEKLIAEQNLVFGSTRSHKNADELRIKGINSFVFSNNSQISSKIVDKTDVVILSIPPVNRNNPPFYGKLLTSIAQQFNPSTRFIFLGSTGIYPRKEGIFNEDYDFLDAEKNNSLYQAEDNLKKNLENRLCVFRLGGLIGEDRNPVSRLIKKKAVKNPESPINYIHQKDVIAAIQFVVENQLFSHTFNIVHPDHPIRKAYYEKKCNEQNLPPVDFSQEKSVIRKILGNRIVQEHNFTYLHKP